MAHVNPPSIVIQDWQSLDVLSQKVEIDPKLTIYMWDSKVIHKWLYDHLQPVSVALPSVM